MSYAEMLRDPRWQRRRLEVLDEAHFRCRHCHSTENELHVHHTVYVKGKKPWDYGGNELIVPCKDCHAIAEDLRDSINVLVGLLSPSDGRQVLGHAAGLFLLNDQTAMTVTNDSALDGFASAVGLPVEEARRLGPTVTFDSIADKWKDLGYLREMAKP